MDRSTGLRVNGSIGVLVCLICSGPRINLEENNCVAK